MKIVRNLCTFCMVIFGTPLLAQEIIIENPSVRIVGSHAAELADLIENHRLVSEDIPILGPDEDGDFTTLFVLLAGWSSIDKMPALKEICADLCIPEAGKSIHLVSTTKIDGNRTRKSVFLDLNAVAPRSDISGSLGFSGCVAEQIKIEALFVRAEHSPCLVRLVGGSFTDRRRVSRNK